MTAVLLNQTPFPSSSSTSTPPLSQSTTKPPTPVLKTTMPPPTMTLNPSYCHPAFFTSKLRRSPSFTLQPGPHSTSPHAVSPVVHGYMFQDAQRLQGPGSMDLGNLVIGSAKVAGGNSRL
ncbi:hypothetical protein QBC32DRAFT_347417 [Pseudoneurospora amorphoporcata]|uniref:Uncharacterized protein n=1 Tax=Pseudoneurospora amorphoporcata TaxID=241081 RepID=A0AAN6NTX7_9PEZI|nr:hypothetical protein QBC32DRAFT_347417 [Pseudoneurospora amorphoporcata]